MKHQSCSQHTGHSLPSPESRVTHPVGRVSSGSAALGAPPYSLRCCFTFTEVQNTLFIQPKIWHTESISSARCTSSSCLSTQTWLQRSKRFLQNQFVPCSIHLSERKGCWEQTLTKLWLLPASTSCSQSSVSLGKTRLKGRDCCTAATAALISTSQHKV